MEPKNLDSYTAIVNGFEITKYKFDVAEYLDNSPSSQLFLRSLLSVDEKFGRDKDIHMVDIAQ